ncbi:MAG: rhomboid family intramembrane serine protease [Planctomycetia bacterium]|nr:rhomboid family intramembrane serine protease [Planctomycetia bacterium]
MIALPELSFRRTPVTLVLMGVAVALELAFTVRPEMRVDFYYKWLGILPCIWAGQLWRPFTSSLMHADPIHAAFNVYWLAIFGQTLEIRFGSYRVLGLIVLVSYVSMMPEYVIGGYHRRELVPIVGLSGVIYGLFGVLLVGRRWESPLGAVCDDQTVKLLIGWFFLCIALTYLEILPVANIAHGAGFLFGVVYGLAIFDARRRVGWLALSALMTVVVLSTLIACPGHPGYEQMRWYR